MINLRRGLLPYGCAAPAATPAAFGGSAGGASECLNLDDHHSGTADRATHGSRARIVDQRPQAARTVPRSAAARP